MRSNRRPRKESKRLEFHWNVFLCLEMQNIRGSNPKRIHCVIWIWFSMRALPYSSYIQQYSTQLRAPRTTHWNFQKKCISNGKLERQSFTCCQQRPVVWRWHLCEYRVAFIRIAHEVAARTYHISHRWLDIGQTTHTRTHIRHTAYVEHTRAFFKWHFNSLSFVVPARHRLDHHRFLPVHFAIQLQIEQNESALSSHDVHTTQSLCTCILIGKASLFPSKWAQFGFAFQWLAPWLRSNHNYLIFVINCYLCHSIPKRN